MALRALSTSSTKKGGGEACWNIRNERDFFEKASRLASSSEFCSRDQSGAKESFIPLHSPRSLMFGELVAMDIPEFLSPTRR